MKKAFACIAMVVVSVQYGLSQCSMCSATTETSLDQGSTAALGLNRGVLYLFVMPFLFAVIFYFIYRNRKMHLQAMENQKSNSFKTSQLKNE